MDPNQISRFVVMMTVTMNIQPGSIAIIMNKVLWQITKNMKNQLQCSVTKNSLRGIVNPPETASFIGDGSCCMVLTAWPKTPFSCCGIDTSSTVGVSSTPSVYSSFILSGPSTVNFELKMNLFSICISTSCIYFCTSQIRTIMKLYDNQRSLIQTQKTLLTKNMIIYLLTIKMNRMSSNILPHSEISCWQ